MPDTARLSKTGPRCPGCDAPLEGNLGRVPVSIDEETVKIALDCEICAEYVELEGGLRG